MTNDSKQVDRRSFLATGAGVVAVATIAFAEPAAASTPRIRQIIERHRDAEAAYLASMQARDAITPKSHQWPEIFVPLSIGGGQSARLDDWPARTVEVLRRDISLRYERAIDAIEKPLGHLDNEIVEQAKARLRKAQAADLRTMRRLVSEEAAKVENSSYGAARRANEQALDAERDALCAVLSHRCTSMDELAEKAGYLADFYADMSMDGDHQSMLLASMRPEGVDFHQELTRDFRRELTRLSGMFRFGGGGQGPTFPLRGFGFMR